MSSFDQSSLKMSIMNVRIVNDNSGLPEHFDVDKVKEKWLDSKSWQLWESKFGFMNSKHHWRRCGRWVWSKCSMQVRSLCKSSDKKHRVWDRWDFKLDNIEFENTYRSVLVAEDEIIDMHEYKKIDFEKKIKESENKEIMQRNINNERNEKRKSDKVELEEKIDNTMKELQFINKSKNLLTKNIKNEDDRINELNIALDKLRQEKYRLVLKKNNALSDYEEYQEKVDRFDPEFVKKIREDIDISMNNQNQTLASNNLGLSNSGQNKKLDEVRNQIKNESNMQEKLRIMEEMQNVKDMMESEDEDDIKKFSSNKNDGYIEKEEFDDNKIDNSFGTTSFTK